MTRGTITDPSLICPECGEPALATPPRTWTPAWGPPPPYAHADGEPLCPVVGSGGYEPAQPVPNDRMERPS